MKLNIAKIDRELKRMNINRSALARKLAGAHGGVDVTCDEQRENSERRRVDVCHGRNAAVTGLKVAVGVPTTAGPSSGASCTWTDEGMIGYVSRHGFAPFAYWRIAVGVVGVAAPVRHDGGKPGFQQGDAGVVRLAAVVRQVAPADRAGDVTTFQGMPCLCAILAFWRLQG